MIPLSSRFALASLAIFLAAAIPVWTFGVDRTHSDCRDPEALVSRLPGSETHGMTPAVTQSFEPYELYGRPLGDAVASSYPDSKIRLRDLQVDGVTLPVHWSSDTTQVAARVRAYFYVHGGEPVVHPFASGLALAPAQFAQGTLPVTLLLIDGFTELAKRQHIEQAAEDWIRNAWRHYQTSCL